MVADEVVVCAFVIDIDILGYAELGVIEKRREDICRGQQTIGFTLPS